MPVSHKDHRRVPVAGRNRQPVRLAVCKDHCRYRCQSVPVRERPGRYAHQSRLAKKSPRAASRRRTIWKVFCVTRRPRLSATKGHALEGACTCAGAFHLPGGGEGAERVHCAVGLLQDPTHHPGAGGGPAARAIEVRARQALTSYATCESFAETAARAGTPATDVNAASPCDA